MMPVRKDQSASGPVLIDGVSGPGLISVFDSGFLRGDGCFEAIRSYGGRLFAFSEHYARLENSARGLGLQPPPRHRLQRWAEEVAAAAGDCIVRLVLTRGGEIPGRESSPRCIVLAHPVPPPNPALALARLTAPWHPAGRPWELSGVKTISYAPNQAATRRAQAAGCDDALLVSDQGIVLEGPTFSVAWVREKIVETPDLELGILASITRQFLFDACRDLGFEVVEGQFHHTRLEQATELLALSTVKEICPVRRLDGHVYPAGPVGVAIGDAYRDIVQASWPQLTTGR